MLAFDTPNNTDPITGTQSSLVLRTAVTWSSFEPDRLDDDKTTSRGFNIVRYIPYCPSDHKGNSDEVTFRSLPRSPLVLSAVDDHNVQLESIYLHETQLPGRHCCASEGIEEVGTIGSTAYMPSRAGGPRRRWARAISRVSMR